MFLQIENLLAPAELQTIVELARQAKFVDGRLSNPHNTSKNSVIAESGDPLARQSAQIALAALQRNEQLRNFVLRSGWPCPSWFATKPA